MKHVFIFILLGLTTYSYSQEVSHKLPVFGSVSVGYGNTFFSGTLSEKEERNDQRGFGRNDGITLATFYYWSPESWRGWGVGTGFKAFVARPNNGDNQETYTYNYYHVGVSVRNYLITKRFNEGLFLMANAGWGQGTEKYSFGNTDTHKFQNASGITVLGGIGYAIPLGGQRSALNLDLSYEYANRNAEVTNSNGTVDYINSQVSFSVGLVF
ncbi:MAG: hypothetical protein WBA23_16645 [Tunicatimonas sp.]|uniref:hypothetical protein n=1 Tax=Tunicatimonas sp. TaxID=1940096 RepID=UPI003C738438